MAPVRKDSQVAGGPVSLPPVLGAADTVQDREGAEDGGEGGGGGLAAAVAVIPSA